MKKINDINSEIEKITAEALPISKSEASADKKKVKAIKTRLKYLREIKKYIEFNPNEDFLKSEVNRLNNHVTIIKHRYAKFLEVCSAKEKAKLFKSEGITQMNKQILNLKFILS